MRFDSLPESVVALIEVRDAWRRRVAKSHVGLEFLVSDLARWQPGSTVRVAFLDGDATLHADVAAATAQITENCNLELDFGVDAGGQHRRWTEVDTAYAAEIRVSFDLGGFFSLVGTDSNDPTISSAGDSVGGQPHQRSLNLGGFINDRPDDWEGTVRHEFLHALAFRHSHQNMRGPCEQQFRWDDDPDYIPTLDPRGVFVADAAGRQPGIYTFLAGEPNRWSKAKVDHNLRTEEDPADIAGPFDPASVMLYQFPPFFYKSAPSACAPTGNGIDLSAGDKRGLNLLYPGVAAELEVLDTRAAAALDALGATSGLESAGLDGGMFRDRVLSLLSERLGSRV